MSGVNVSGSAEKTDLAVVTARQFGRGRCHPDLGCSMVPPKDGASLEGFDPFMQLSTARRAAAVRVLLGIGFGIVWVVVGETMGYSC